MGRTMSQLEQLGRRVAAKQDEEQAALGDDVLEEARARLLSEPPKPARVAQRRWLTLAAAAMAASFLLWLSFRLVNGPAAPPLSFDVGPSQRIGVVSEWLRAPREQDLALRFSDGSSVLLRADARARVVAVSASGARVAIERGRAAVSVNPKANGNWLLQVGPFDVVVTGTRFDVSWDAKAEVFSIELHNGSVLVSGPRIEGSRPVVAGQKLLVVVARRQAATSDADAGHAGPTISPAASTEPSAQLPPTAPLSDAGTLPPPPVESAGWADAAAGVAPQPPSWTLLASKGKYKEALADAEALGFSAICASGSAPQLLMLADVARFAGKSGRSRQAYQALRKRFAGSGQAAMAAFALGRMAFHGGSHGAGIRWFNVYLQEAPSGSLASAALGRIMEAQHAQGSKAAKATAAQYLARYPKGPHAQLAQKIIKP